MKLKYIFSAVIAAVMFTACSNDNTPGPVGPSGEEMIALSIGIDNGTIKKTKADSSEDKKGLTDEDKVNKLTAILFDGNSVIVKKDTIAPAGGSLDRIGDIFVPAGTYDILLIANANSLDIKTKDDLKNYNGWAEQKQDNLLMVSEFYENVQLYPLDKNGESIVDPASDTEKLRLTYIYWGKENKEHSATKRDKDKWYQAGTTAIPLTRLAARIQLKSITLKLENDLQGGTFKLEEVYLTNVRPATGLLLGGNLEVTPTEGALYYRGAPETVTQPGSDLIYPGTAGYIGGNLYKTYSNIQLSPSSLTHTFTVDENADMFYWYAFENRAGDSDIKEVGNRDTYFTRMIVAGTITPPGNKPTETRYYQVNIQENKQLLHNNIYQVNLTIRGLGSGDPNIVEEEATISVKVDVEPWQIVEHTEIITD